MSEPKPKPPTKRELRAAQARVERAVAAMMKCTPEEQAMIDARVAKMQAALKASREAKKGILAAVGDDLPGLVAEGTA